ncbi:MAG: RND transporter [Bdellovibrionales bacterium CG12_big_fil_rev_8_21_14_0_65_38_15]|nr:MAG: RND transporter [Bdellovibrionales bacterium CG22_combo_CG10-13_8_21_14_all_38_13]PIQ57005.1 MAG: RND transporter [Bdellovibrionales bacterium CG12_big_fil_rev_8_21_14_0_65_38_15]PIR29034.1 MAG: RND transporter [Bdellovibrionales bacterium CG11_big_fil_rev_8_21_14_0_20_38_13]
MNEYRRKNNAYKLSSLPHWIILTNRYAVILFIAFIFFIALTPWMQTSIGSGSITALDPNDRVQTINAPVSGRIFKWHINDGDFLKAGETIVEIVDIDPDFASRLQSQRDSVLRKYQSSKLAAETALLNFKRQTVLFKDGLAAKKEVEKAKIEYQKLISDEEEAASSLYKIEVQLARQQTQVVTAPKDGNVLRVYHGSGNVLVKAGEALATFVPRIKTPAVELYIDANDLPLIQPGQHVRLQFEGWPAVQFSGWPSAAIGTFGAKVQNVDSLVMEDGKFRIIAIEDQLLETDEWPDYRFLRQGGRVKGWVLLNKVTLGYEWWRKLNGFPATAGKPLQKLKKDEK